MQRSGNEMIESVDKFCKRHGIAIVDTNKRAYRMTHMNTQYFAASNDYNEFVTAPRMDTEPLYTVEIAESELTSLADFETDVFNHQSTQGNYNMFETLMKQKQQERYLRDKYPSVATAYENYSLMLHLAQAGEI